jgi:hypothetical protein
LEAGGRPLLLVSLGTGMRPPTERRLCQGTEDRRLSCLRGRRLLELWRRAKAGGAILSDWRRYAREVALPSSAFGIPVTLYTVFLVASSHMLSGLFAITPGGVGQTQALDVVTLRGYASAEDIAAFSITQDAVLTIWNVVLGVAVAHWAFSYAQVRDLVRSRGKKAPEQAPPEA